MDGLSWWIDYVGTLMRFHSSFTERYVTKRLPMVKGWIWYAQAVVSDPMNRFSGVKPEYGFIAQERDKLIQEAKDYYAKHGRA